MPRAIGWAPALLPSRGGVIAGRRFTLRNSDSARCDWEIEEVAEAALLPVAPTLRSGKLDRPVKYRFFGRSNFWPYGTTTRSSEASSICRRRNANGCMSIALDRGCGHFGRLARANPRTTLTRDDTDELWPLAMGRPFLRSQGLAVAGAGSGCHASNDRGASFGALRGGLATARRAAEDRRQPERHVQPVPAASPG